MALFSRHQHRAEFVNRKEPSAAADACLAKDCASMSLAPDAPSKDDVEDRAEDEPEAGADQIHQAFDGQRYFANRHRLVRQQVFAGAKILRPITAGGSKRGPDEGAERF